MLGFSSLGTMKIKEETKSKVVIVLINCGATHNLILSLKV